MTYYFRLLRGFIALATALACVAGSPVLAENATFKSVCSDCHTGGFKGFMSGAPNVNKPDTWQKFLQRDSEQHMRETVLRGNKDHKAKGGCNSCTDKQVNAAIDYMLGLVK